MNQESIIVTSIDANKSSFNGTSTENNGLHAASEARQEVINWLKSYNYPALPVAPAQEARKYYKINKTNGKRGIWENCPLTEDLQPIPLYTGKNPSYLDKNGIPHLINHRQYQKRLPTRDELKVWFANESNGIGTLGGWNNTVWLDFDVKQFPSQQECDDAVKSLVERWSLQQTFIERSHSGGWRVGIRVEEKPEFTNFALALGGKHIGEALGVGRFTVLAPTIGVSGNSYQSINRTLPVEVMNLESIGIYPTSTPKPVSEVRTTSQSITGYIPGNIPLEQLGTDTSREILQGNCPTGDHSEALATALQEWYGWQNWTIDNGVPITGTPEDLAHYAGTRLGIDSDRINRILKTVDPAQCHPAALYRGDEKSCWKKIYRLDKGTFEAKCPAHIKDSIKRAYQSSPNTSCSKLSLRDAVAKAEEILKTQISSQLDPIEANICLEELRQETSVNEYNWEQKYLKPIREKLERSLALPASVNQPTDPMKSCGNRIDTQNDTIARFKSKLLAIANTDDPIIQLLKINELASNYRMPASEIRKAIAKTETATRTPKAQFHALDDFLSMKSEELDYLIPGLLPRGETVLCAGLPKSGKTLLAIDAAFAIATGESKFLGEQVLQGRVLLVSVDESAQSTKNKLLKRGFRARDAENVAVMTQWDVSQMSELESKLEDFRPDLVIIDSLKRITAGREISENSAEFADIIYQLKELTGRSGAASILIHHANKNNEAVGVSKVRGSTAIAGACWGIWQLDHIIQVTDKNGKPIKGKPKFDPSDPRRIFTAICRDAENQNLTIQFNPENHSYSVVASEDIEAQAEKQTQEQLILDLLTQYHPKGLTGREIMEALGIGRGIYTVLDRMVNRRTVTQQQSKTDRRSMVYALQKKGDTPPPLPCVQMLTNLSESTVVETKTNSQHLVNNESTDNQRTFDENEAVDYSTPDQMDNSGDSQQLLTTGEGVCASPDNFTELNTLELSHASSEATINYDTHYAEQPASGVEQVTDVIKLQVGDHVHIQAGGRFDGKSATVLDSSNPDEIVVRLDQAGGGFDLVFPAQYLVHIEEEF